jgi:hypothetical protein
MIMNSFRPQQTMPLLIRGLAAAAITAGRCLGVATAGEWQSLMEEHERLIDAKAYEDSLEVARQARAVAEQTTESYFYRKIASLVAVTISSAAVDDLESASESVGKAIDAVEKVMRPADILGMLNEKWDDRRRDTYDLVVAQHKALNAWGGKRIPPAALDERSLLFRAILLDMFGGSATDCEAEPLRTWALLPDVFEAKGGVCLKQNDAVAAEMWFRRGLEWAELVWGKNSLAALQLESELAWACSKQDKMAVAIAMVRHIAEAYEKIEGESDSASAMHEQLAIWYRRKGDEAAAKEAELKAKSLKEASPVANDSVGSAAAVGPRSSEDQAPARSPSP